MRNRAWSLLASVASRQHLVGDWKLNAELSGTWSVGGDPLRLTVLLEIKRSSGGTVSVKRVFDPVAKS